MGKTVGKNQNFTSSTTLCTPRHRSMCECAPLLTQNVQADGGLADALAVAACHCVDASVLPSRVPDLQRDVTRPAVAWIAFTLMDTVCVGVVVAA